MFWQEYERVRTLDDWTTETMATKHDAMIEAPDDLAARLERMIGEVNKMADC